MTISQNPSVSPGLAPDGAYWGDLSRSFQGGHRAHRLSLVIGTMLCPGGIRSFGYTVSDQPQLASFFAYTLLVCFDDLMHVGPLVVWGDMGGSEWNVSSLRRLWGELVLPLTNSAFANASCLSSALADTWNLNQSWKPWSI